MKKTRWIKIAMTLALAASCTALTTPVFACGPYGGGGHSWVDWQASEVTHAERTLEIAIEAGDVDAIRTASKALTVARAQLAEDRKAHVELRFAQR